MEEPEPMAWIRALQLRTSGQLTPFSLLHFDVTKKGGETLVKAYFEYKTELFRHMQK